MTLSDLLSTFEPLEIGDGFVLRAVAIDDADALAAFVAANRGHLGRFLPGLVDEIVDVETARLHCEQMVSRFVEWAFDALRLHRIELRCVASNIASAAVAHRLGFVLEGRLRGCELIDGEFHDDLVFSRLCTDDSAGAKR